MILELINSNNNFRPFFKDGQTNHLPMTLFAMFKLGASAKELNDFIEEYKKIHNMEKLQVVTSSINQSNWTQFFGQTEKYEEYQEFFKKEVEQNGTRKLIEKYFNLLVSGIASEAFHCLIKLCYAIESDNTDEVINALAYMCACYFEIPTIEKQPSNKSVASIITDIESSKWFSKNTYEGHTISEKIITVFEDTEFSKHLEFPDFTREKVMLQLKNSVLKIHLGKWNFISLHLVTSFHSLKIIEPFVVSKENLYKQYWTSLIGCLVTMNKVVSTSLSLDIVCDFNWETTFKKALETKEEHAIKLVYSCSQEYKNNYDLLYEAIASRATHQICI